MTKDQESIKINSSIHPRRWQLDALKLWSENFRGVVSVITGAGKTVFAELCIEQFLNRHSGAKIIIIVPTIVLLDQWYVSLEEDLGLTSAQIACYSGQEKSEKPSFINLMVLNTARKYAPKLSELFNTFLIVDECHRVASTSNALSLRGHHIATLGLSATPEREYDRGFEEIIVPALGNIIYRYDYQQAYKDGIICPFKILNVRINLTSSEKQKYNQLSRSALLAIRKTNKEHLKNENLKIILQKRAAVSANAKMRIPVAAKLAESNNVKKTIVFHERIKAAETLFEILTKRKRSVTTYHSKLSPNLRRDNIRLFRQGIFDILISCRALDEGTNIPETSTLIIASSSASARQRIQRIGRALRPSQGKKEAIIYTIYATKAEEKRLKQEEKNFDELVTVSWLKASR